MPLKNKFMIDDEIQDHTVMNIMPYFIYFMNGISFLAFICKIKYYNLQRVFGNVITCKDLEDIFTSLCSHFTFSRALTSEVHARYSLNLKGGTQW